MSFLATNSLFVSINMTQIILTKYITFYHEHIFFCHKIICSKILLVATKLLFVAKNMEGIIQLFSSQLFVEKYYF